jgi:hypothetical protein
MTIRQAQKLCSLFAREERVTRTDIHRALGRNESLTEIEPVLTNLLDAGILRVVRERAAAGRAVDFYELVEDMNDWLEEAISAGKISAGPCRPRQGRPAPPVTRRLEDVIYFIQAGKAGPIKIGLTYDVSLRLSILQIGSPLPLRLLAIQPGKRDVEISLHERFSALRLHGEWFEPAEELLDYIRENAKVLTGEGGVRWLTKQA